MSRRTSSGTRDESAPGRAARSRGAIRGTRPGGNTVVVRKPVVGIGRNSAQHYDPVTGRKLTGGADGPAGERR